MVRLNRDMNRRDFLRLAGAGIAGGAAVIVVGNKLRWLTGNTALAATHNQALHFRITDAIKEMATHNYVNKAECYFWVYKSVDPADPNANPPIPSNPALNLLAESPGPVIMAAKGDVIHIKVTNDLPEPHAFSIPDLNVVSNAIAPGGSWEGDIVASSCGAFLYYDNLNEPVNRMMGLHGALIVLPTQPQTPGHKITPYDNPTANVQALFDSFGTAVYPGLAWEGRDDTPWALNGAFPEFGNPNSVNTPPFRHYLWLLHQASPRLFAEVGDYYATHNNTVYPAQEFMDKFLRGDSVLNNNENAHSGGIQEISYRPQYFLVNGQSGFFAHDSAYVTPTGRVGEPVIVYILNAGMWLHSMHLHANHFYVTNVNHVVQDNPVWVDVFNVHPMDRVDYVIPFMKPPDVPNQRGIGRPDTALGTCWPPQQEMNVRIPDIGEEKAFRPLVDSMGMLILDANGQPQPGVEVDLEQRLSPLCYPMHDHAEPSQTSQGGNYNTGLISGIYFTGDRNAAPEYFDFPMEHDFWLMFQNDRGCAVDGTHEAAPPHGHDGGH